MSLVSSGGAIDSFVFARRFPLGETASRSAYPPRYRHSHEDELLGTLLDAADPGRGLW
jgi:hypothetical protein